MTNSSLNSEKYKEVIKYIIESLGHVQGKKKMYKLLYFLDFDFYELYEESLTGETYKKLVMGPAPVNFDRIIGEMDDEIKVEHKKLSPLHENDTYIYKVKVKSRYKFTKREKSMLDRVILKYGQLNGSQLETLSHSEAPWNAVKMFDEIPYEYSFYRETQDLNI